MGLIRSLVTLAVLAGLVYCGATVKLGNKTFFGHVAAIWRSNETQDLVEGVKDKTGPVVDKVKRGVEAGVREASDDDDSTKPDDGDKPAGDGDKPETEDPPGTAQPDSP